MRTTCFLQIEPTFQRYDRDRLASISVARITSKRPHRPLPGSVVIKIKLTLDVADKAFAPLAPSVEVTVPAEHVDVIEIVSEPVEIVE